jgi:hypothetical protein
MTPDERGDAELDHEDAVHDALADLGVAVREFAEARQAYERAIAAVGAAGARMKAAAANEERALGAVRALYGSPEVVDAEIVEDDPAIYCDPHEMPEEAPDACTHETGLACPFPGTSCFTCGAGPGRPCQQRSAIEAGIFRYGSSLPRRP